jgi:tellurite resistance protein TerC
LTVPAWAWAAFLAFVIAMLALDVFVLHRKAHEVSLREAGIWSAVWIVLGLGFGGLVWAWAGGATAQAYLAGYLIEKSLSVDNIFLFAAIFAAFAIPARYQHRVLMFGIIGALVMRAAFIAAGITLLEAIHPVIYVFGAVLLLAAFNMLRGGTHAPPEQSRVLRWLRRWLPVTDQLHGQRFMLRADDDGEQRGRLLATPLLLALVVVETTDVIFAVDSIPAILAVTTDPFVVYTSNVFALLGMRALYFLLAGAAGRLRYLRPGLAVILAAVAVKLLLADVWEFPAWSAPAFITVVLAVAAAASLRDTRRAPRSGPARASRTGQGLQDADRAPARPG